MRARVCTRDGTSDEQWCEVFVRRHTGLPRVLREESTNSITCCRSSAAPSTAALFSEPAVDRSTPRQPTPRLGCVCGGTVNRFWVCSIAKATVKGCFPFKRLFCTSLWSWKTACLRPVWSSRGCCRWSSCPERGVRRARGLSSTFACVAAFHRTRVPVAKECALHSVVLARATGRGGAGAFDSTAWFGRFGHFSGRDFFSFGWPVVPFAWNAACFVYTVNIRLVCARLTAWVCSVAKATVKGCFPFKRLLCTSRWSWNTSCCRWGCCPERGVRRARGLSPTFACVAVSHRTRVPAAKERALHSGVLARATGRGWAGAFDSTAWFGRFGPFSGRDFFSFDWLRFSVRCA